MTTWYLKKTLSATGNSFGFYGTNVQLDFDTALTKVTEKLDKLYKGEIPRYRSRKDWDDYSPSTILIDLKATKWTFIVTGVLVNDTGNLSTVNPTTTATAINKKNLLIAFAEDGGTMSFFHRNFGGNRPTGTNHPNNIIATAENVNIVSLQFDDEETEVGTNEVYMKNNERRISFSMVLQKGIDRG